MIRILIRNILSNWAGLAVQVSVVFFLTPFVISHLGNTTYGIWALVTGLTGYYGMLDMGFRSGITQYLARHLATRDFDQLNRTASTACVVLSFCGTLVALTSLAIMWISPHVFTIPVNAVIETRWCIAVVGLSTAFQFAFFPFSAVFAATQRYDLANLIAIATRLASAAGTYFALEAGTGLLGLCLVQSAGDVVGSLIRWRVAYRIIPQLELSSNLAAWANVRSIAHFGLWSFVIQNIVSLRDYTGIIISGMVLPVAALAHYHLAISLKTYFDQFFRSITVVFFPAATQLDAAGDYHRLQLLYTAGSRLVLLLAVPLSLIGFIWADDFYRLWVGPSFVAGDDYTSVATLFRILLISGAITTCQMIGNQVLLGTRNLRLLTNLVVLETITFLALMLLLIRPFRLVGIVLATFLSTVIFRGLVHPTIVCRLLGMSTRTYFWNVYSRPCLVAIALAIPLVALSHWSPSEPTWGMLFVTGVVAIGVSVPLLLLLGLQSDERKRFVTDPLLRFQLKLARRKSMQAMGK